MNFVDVLEVIIIFKKILFYASLLLPFGIPASVLACDCDSHDSPWYKQLPTQTLGYIAQEFDKMAPAPGMNWKGSADEWFSNAAYFGWIEKTAPQDAQAGAIILWKNANQEVSVGVVCQVTADHIVYKSPNENGTLMQSSIDFGSLAKEFHFIGYIYPLKVDGSKQTRLILK